MGTNIKIGGKSRLCIGEDKTLRGHVKDESGNSVDVTGWGGKFDARTSDSAPDPPLIEKAWTVSGSFSATNNPQRLVVPLTDTELSIVKGTHRHSWKRTDEGSESILARGDFVVEEATQK